VKKLASILLLIALLGSLYPMAVLAEEEEEEEPPPEEPPDDGWGDADGDGIPDQFDPFPDDAENDGMPEDVVQQFIEAAENIKQLEELLGGEDEEDDGEGEDEEDDGEGEDEEDDGEGEDEEDDEDDEGIGDDDETEEEVSQAVQTLYNVATKLLLKAAEKAAQGKVGAAKGLSNAAMHTSGNALKKYEKDNGEIEDEDDEEYDEDEEDDEDDDTSTESTSKGKGKGKGKDKNKDKGKGKGKGKGKSK
jgi:hypothetical protein